MPLVIKYIFVCPMLSTMCSLTEQFIKNVKYFSRTTRQWIYKHLLNRLIYEDLDPCIVAWKFLIEILFYSVVWKLHSTGHLRTWILTMQSVSGL